MQRISLKSKIQEIESEDVIQKWLEDTAKETQKAYLNSIALFCKINNKNPTEMLEIAEYEQDKRIPERKRQLKKWLDTYKKFLHDPGIDYSKTTVDIRKANVNGFFHFFEVDTPKDRKKRRRQNKLKIKNQRESLTKENIKEAVLNARTLKLKALILAQCSSGLHKVDLLNLTVEQFKEGLIKIDKKRELCLIKNTRKKTSVSHYTFFNYEAVEMIHKYLELERTNQAGYLFSSTRHTTTQYKLSSYASVLRKLNVQLGLITDEYLFNKITSGMFRKFFETQLTNDELIQEHLFHFMGWILPDNRKSYYLAHPEVLQKSYIKHLNCLTILEDVETVTIESDEVKEIKEKMEPVLWIADLLQKDPELLEHAKEVAAREIRK